MYKHLHILLIHNYASEVQRSYHHQASVLHMEGVLTVNCDFDFAPVRRGHAVVGDAFVVFSLLPLDLGDV